MNEQLDDTALSQRFPWVRLDHDTKNLFRAWLDRRFVITRCDDCRRYHHPPKPVCPACWSSALTLTPVSGRGTAHLVMLLHQGAPAPGVDYGKGPHPVVTVELEEQEHLRFTSTVVDCPPEDVRIGMPLELVWIDRYGAPFPAFRPRENG